MLYNLVQLGCSHVYHKKCIAEWKGTKNTCPQCIQPITIMNPVYITKKRSCNDIGAAANKRVKTA